MNVRILDWPNRGDTGLIFGGYVPIDASFPRAIIEPRESSAVIVLDLNNGEVATDCVLDSEDT
jgi:hypothetical protein